MIVKNLQRLFPVDTDMVVIIDDRGDVWKWSQNLIKVTPYDFFVGIGDINSSFLPKRVDLATKLKAGPPKVVVETTPETDANDGSAPATEEPREADIVTDEALPSVLMDPTVPSPASDLATLGTQLVAMSGGDDPNILEEQSHAQAEAIASQVEDRPLLKKQEMLDKLDEEEESKEQNGVEGNDTPSEHEHKHRHNLLHDDDEELQYLQQHLTTVHRFFFEDYDQKLRGVGGGRVSQLRGEKSPKKARRPTDDPSLVPDVKDIMPNMKMDVLQGVVICFTGVIPQGVSHES